MSGLIGTIWKLIAIQPVTNILIVLTNVLFSNFGLAIIALTIIIKLLTHPLNMRQVRSTKAMQDIQPKLTELQKKYGRDRQRFLQEQMALYKEAGISPTGCMLPLLIQFPVWFALYQSIIRVLAVAPEDLLELSQYLYSRPIIYANLPLPHQFLWLDLALPDRYWVLPILVGITMWLQQKQIETPSRDPQQQSQQRMMLWTMPMMFAIFTLSFPSGLAIYWVASNIITIITQYLVAGWGGLATIGISNPFAQAKKPVRRKTPVISAPAPVATEITEISTTQEEGLSDEESRDKRQDSGGGGPKRPGTSRHQTGRYKGRRSKRR